MPIVVGVSKNEIIIKKEQDTDESKKRKITDLILETQEAYKPFEFTPMVHDGADFRVRGISTNRKILVEVPIRKAILEIIKDLITPELCPTKAQKVAAVRYLITKELQIEVNAPFYVADSKYRAFNPSTGDYDLKIGKSLFAKRRLQGGHSDAGFLLGKFNADEIIDRTEQENRVQNGKGRYILELSNNNYLDCYHNYLLGLCPMSFANSCRNIKHIETGQRAESKAFLSPDFLSKSISLKVKPKKSIYPDEEVFYSYSDEYNLSGEYVKDKDLSELHMGMYIIGGQENENWYFNTQGTGFCGYLALTQIEENNGIKLKIEKASDRSRVIECCQRMLQSCSYVCHPDVAQQIRDTIVFLQNLGSEDLPIIPWLPRDQWLEISGFNRCNIWHDIMIYYNPIATDSIKYLFFNAIPGNSLKGCYEFLSCSHQDTPMTTYNFFKDVLSSKQYRGICYAREHYFLVEYDHDLIESEFYSSVDNLATNIVEQFLLSTPTPSTLKETK
jgi:hypothetical protein